MWKELALACGFAGFIIGTTKLLMEWLDFALALAASTGLFLGLLAVIFAVDVILASRVHHHRPLYSRLFMALIRRMRSLFEPIVIRRWHTQISISQTGKAKVRTEIEGKVNYGRNRWITCVIHTSVPQRLMSAGFDIVAQDVASGRRFLPDQVIDEPTYKMFRLRFGDVLGRGQVFHFIFEYDLENSFFLDRPDFWYHVATRCEEKVTITIIFPQGYKVKDTYSGELTTEYGDNTWEQPDKEPQLTNERCLKWEIDWVERGSKYKLCWELEKG
jgi:hypothetical protein